MKRYTTRKARSSTRPIKRKYKWRIRADKRRTDCGFTVITTIDEPKRDEDAQGASDYVGDVARMTGACTRDATSWIDAYWRSLRVER